MYRPFLFPRSRVGYARLRGIRRTLCHNAIGLVAVFLTARKPGRAVQSYLLHRQDFFISDGSNVPTGREIVIILDGIIDRDRMAALLDG